MHPLSSTYDENQSISARNGTQPTRCRSRQQTAKPSKLRTPACKRSAPNRCSEWGFPCLQQYGQRFQGIIDWSPSGEHLPLSGAQPMQIASRTAAATHTLTDGHGDFVCQVVPLQLEVGVKKPHFRQKRHRKRNEAEEAAPLRSPPVTQARRQRLQALRPRMRHVGPSCPLCICHSSPG